MIRLQVITPSGTLVDKQVERVTVPGEAGSFTILLNHAPIISTLVAGRVTYMVSGREESVGIRQGVIHGAKNIVKIIGSAEQ